MEFSKIKNRSVIEFRMEIFVTDKYAQSIIGDVDGDNGLAFLKPPGPKGGAMESSLN